MSSRASIRPADTGAAAGKRRGPALVGWLGWAGALFGVSIVALLVGSTSIGFGALIGALSDAADPMLRFVLLQVRLPAVLLSACVGAGLGAAGAAMQGLLRNPLADPYLLGVSGGAALAAAFTLGLAPAAHVSWLLPIAVFAGALGATALLAGVARALPGGLRGAGATTTLILSGVVFNALAGAILLLLHALLMPAKSQELLLWLMGAIVPTRLDGPAPWVALTLGVGGFAWLLRLAPALNVLSLGDDDAASLGVSPERTRRAVLVATATVVGSAVAYTGLIGFVGLLVPHMVRFGRGADHRAVIPLSAVAGATFLVAADAVARRLFAVADTVIPVGVVTAFLGVPLFFVLLHRHLRGQA